VLRGAAPEHDGKRTPARRAARRSLVPGDPREGGACTSGTSPGPAASGDASPRSWAAGSRWSTSENDGDLDLYLVQSGTLDGAASADSANALYTNDGHAAFTDVSAGSGADDRGYGMGVAAGDVDQDGLTDLYVTNVGPNALLCNRGAARFEDVTVAAGVADPTWSTSAAFLDYDADGDLDLYVCNYVDWAAERELECFSPAGRPDYCSPNSYAAPVSDGLYRNEGEGRFSDVSGPAGILAARANGLGVVAGDFDGDGRIDVFVANDQMENQLWHNRGDATFVDVAGATGCAVDQHGVTKAGMGVAAEDVDDDGDLDLLVVNLRAQSDSFYRNQGKYFEDDTAALGLGSATRPFTRFGVGWVDFDDDGWLDVYEANGRVALVAEREPRADDPYAEPDVVLASAPGGKLRALVPEGGSGRAARAHEPRCGLRRPRRRRRRRRCGRQPRRPRVRAPELRAAARPLDPLRGSGPRRARCAGRRAPDRARLAHAAARRALRLQLLLCQRPTRPRRTGSAHARRARARALARRDRESFGPFEVDREFVLRPSAAR
jgi:hypothetical protein